MVDEPDLFEANRERERRQLVEVLNRIAKPSRRKALCWPLPPITVPDLDPATGHRLRKSSPGR